MAKKLILSLDGGGIRGILSVSLLVSLEEYTGKLTRDTFDFVGGTSTGAIIASSVAAGIPAKELLQDYISLSQQIFKSNFLSPLKRFFFGYFYTTQQLHDLIELKLAHAKNWKINDSPIDLLITSTAIKDGKAWYFVKDNKINTKRTGHLLLADCATASAAAPTYFSPWQIMEKIIKNQTPLGLLTDGGVGVTGNPVYQTCVEAFNYTGKYKPEESIIVSLGTGRYETEFKPGWLLGWVGWLLKELLSSTGEQQTQLVSRHFPQSPFYRFDPDLKMLDPENQNEITLDDANQVDRLLKIGAKFAENVPWKKILNGEKTEFSINQNNAQWEQYKAS